MKNFYNKGYASILATIGLALLVLLIPLTVKLIEKRQEVRKFAYPHPCGECGRPSDCTTGFTCVDTCCIPGEQPPTPPPSRVTCQQSDCPNCSGTCTGTKAYDNSWNVCECEVSSSNPPSTTPPSTSPPSYPEGCCTGSSDCPGGQSCDIPNGACGPGGKSCNPLGSGHHKACQDNMCIETAGPGSDDCTSNSQCANQATDCKSSNYKNAGCCVPGSCCGAGLACNDSGTACDLTGEKATQCTMEKTGWKFSPGFCCAEGFAGSKDGKACNVANASCTATGTSADKVCQAAGTTSNTCLAFGDKYLYCQDGKVGGYSETSTECESKIKAYTICSVTTGTDYVRVGDKCGGCQNGKFSAWMADAQCIEHDLCQSASEGTIIQSGGCAECRGGKFVSISDSFCSGKNSFCTGTDGCNSVFGGKYVLCDSGKFVAETSSSLTCSQIATTYGKYKKPAVSPTPTPSSKLPCGGVEARQANNTNGCEACGYDGKFVDPGAPFCEAFLNHNECEGYADGTAVQYQGDRCYYCEKYKVKELSQCKGPILTPNPYLGKANDLCSGRDPYISLPDDATLENVNQVGGECFGCNENGQAVALNNASCSHANEVCQGQNGCIDSTGYAGIAVACRYGQVLAGYYASMEECNKDYDRLVNAVTLTPSPTIKPIAVNSGTCSAWEDCGVLATGQVKSCAGGSWGCMQNGTEAVWVEVKTPQQLKGTYCSKDDIAMDTDGCGYTCVNSTYAKKSSLCGTPISILGTNPTFQNYYNYYSAQPWWQKAIMNMMTGGVPAGTLYDFLRSFFNIKTATQNAGITPAISTACNDCIKKATDPSECADVCVFGGTVTSAPSTSPSTTQNGVSSKLSGLCLDVQGGSKQDGAAVIQTKCNDSVSQNWQASAYNGFYQIVDQNSGKCLSIQGDPAIWGSKIVQSECGGGDNQLWELKQSGEYYQIINKQSHKCVDIDAFSKKDGLQMQQWECGTGNIDNQLWGIKIVSPTTTNTNTNTSPTSIGSAGTGKYLAGINIDPSDPSGMPTIPEIKDLGVGWVRMVYVDDAHNKNKVDLEKVAQQYLDAGVKVLWILNQDSVNKPIPKSGEYYNPADPAYVKSFSDRAAALAKNFNNPNVAFEIWNEPNQIDNKNAIYVEPANFGKFTQKVYDSIKTGNSKSTVVGGSILGNDPGYMDAAIAATTNKKLPADAVSIHPYVVGDTPGAITYINQNIDTFSKYGKPVWITEIGWEPDPARQAQFVKNVYDLTLTKPQVATTMWYTWSDATNPGFGLVDNQGNEKPSYDVIQKEVTTVTKPPTKL